MIDTSEHPIEVPQIHFIHIKQYMETTEHKIEVPQAHYVDLVQTDQGEFTLPMKRPVMRLQGMTMEHHIDLPVVKYVELAQERITIENMIEIP